MGGGNNEQPDPQLALGRIDPPQPSPSQLPEPPAYQQPQFARNLGVAGSQFLDDLRGLVTGPAQQADIAFDPSAPVGQRLAAGAGAAAAIASMGVPGAREVSPGRISAGEGFMWNAKPIDQIQGLPKSGVMSEGRFAKAGSEAGQFSKGELDLMRQVVPEAFTETGVNVPKLHEGLAESGPVVEVKKLGGFESTPEGQRLAQVRHELDTQLPRWRMTRHEELTPEQRSLRDEHDDLAASSVTGGGGAQYAFVGPKPENQMPGYVEGLVRLPIDPKQFETSSFPTGLKYRGPHFGPEDTNVLSSYRGYEETLPNGEKAFHVIEVQSDWGQARREAEARVPTQTNFGERLKDTRATDHPLLQHYETLGLKAAIQHAKEIGATKVILPDAETAMMTEGHDKAAVTRVMNTPENVAMAKQQYEKLSGDPSYSYYASQLREFINSGRDFDISALRPEWKKDFVATTTVPQAGGMRLHYDQTLPSAMRKLTGDKGTPVDLGEHKSARPAPPSYGEPENPPEYPLKGSPVFRDAAGKPKTNITGKIYDISKTPDQFKLMKAGRIKDLSFWNT